MRDTTRRTLVKFLVCYLIAAAVQTLVVALGTGAPHSGPGSLVLGSLLIFWVMPLTIPAQLYDPDSVGVRGIIYFVVTFAICCLISFRRELRRWR